MRVLEYEQLTDKGAYEARYYAPNLGYVLTPDGNGSFAAEIPTEDETRILTDMFKKGNGHTRLNGDKPLKVYCRKTSLDEEKIARAITAHKQRQEAVKPRVVEKTLEEGIQEAEEEPPTEGNKPPTFPVYQWKGLYPTHRCFVR